MTFDDPLEVRITGAHVDGLPLAAAGEIVFRMAVGDAVIMERRIRVQQRPRS